MNTAPDRTDKTDKTSLVAAAGSALVISAASYESALADQRRDIAEAVASKSHLADGYWQQAHRARLRYLAAAAIMEAVNEG